MAAAIIELAQDSGTSIEPLVAALARRIGAADEDVAPLVSALAPRNCAGLFPGGEP